MINQFQLREFIVCLLCEVNYFVVTLNSTKSLNGGGVCSDFSKSRVPEIRRDNP